nr:dimethyl sulfoxide reductase anchor subunit [Actinomycetota bacterium]
PAGITLSTTRLVLPATVPIDTLAASDQRLRPEDPHWPLIAMTLLTQIALGAVAATVLAELLLGAHRAGALTGGALCAAGAGGLAMAVSLLHLGRPIQAWRALRNLRTSWLSREVALFGLFSVGAIAYAVAWFAGLPTLGLGLLTVGLGAAGVYASGRLYLVPARPVWNSPRTLVAFFATALAMGPLVVALAVDRPAFGGVGVRLLLTAAAAGTVAQLFVYQALIERVASRGEREYRGTARLLFEHFRAVFFMRIAFAAATCALVALATLGAASAGVLAGALACAGAGELIGRYLFYVTVTPMSTAGTFFR